MICRVSPVIGSVLLLSNARRVVRAGQGAGDGPAGVLDTLWNVKASQRKALERIANQESEMRKAQRNLHGGRGVARV